MQFGVDGIYHLYFGDATKHPIIGNYRRSVEGLPQEIVLEQVPPSRLKRLYALVRETVRVRHRHTWALQCHDIFAGLVGIIFWRGRVIYDSHEIFSSFARSRLVAKLVHWLERLVISRADFVVFPSGYRKDYYGVDRPGVVVVENLYYPHERAASADAHGAELDLPAGQPLFAYTGLFTEIRGIREIVSAFADPRLRDAGLVLAGKRNAYLDEVLQAAPPNVRYVGELDHAAVGLLLDRVDAGFALYRPVNENNRRCAPTKIFEFLFHGVAVIANDSPYVRELDERLGGNAMILVHDVASADIVSACDGFMRRARDASRQAPSWVTWNSQMDTVYGLYR